MDWGWIVLLALFVTMLGVYAAGYVVGRVCGRADVEREFADVLIDVAVQDVVSRPRPCPACGRSAGACVHTDPAYGWPRV